MMLMKRETAVSLTGHHLSSNIRLDRLVRSAMVCMIALAVMGCARQVRNLTLRVKADNVLAAQSVAFSQDGRQLAVALEGSVILWDLGSGSKVEALPVEEKEVSALAFSRKGRWLALGGGGRVFIRDRKKETWSRGIRLPEGRAVYLCFSLDDKYLAVQNEKGRSFVFSVKRGRRIRKPGKKLSPGPSMVYSPDWRYMASWGRDGDVQIWDAGSSNLLGKLAGTGDGVRAAAFSSEGRYIAAVSQRDGFVRVWNTASAAPLGTLRLYRGGDWLLTSHEGYFDGTPEGMKNVFWVDGSKMNVARELGASRHSSGLMGRLIGH